MTKSKVTEMDYANSQGAEIARLAEENAKRVAEAQKNDEWAATERAIRSRQSNVQGGQASFHQGNQSKN